MECSGRFSSNFIQIFNVVITGISFMLIFTAFQTGAMIEVGLLITTV